MSTQAFSLKTRQPIADEDALLTEEDRVVKQATEKGADCTTRRRACKNCVCGRAQLEERLAAEGKLGPDDTLESIGNDGVHQMPAGGCGNCAKGDAFRCATCPYRGQPAFDNTEDGRVKLTLTDDI